MGHPKIGVGVDGVVKPQRRNINTRRKAVPAVKLSRLQKLLRSQAPSICVIRGRGIGDVLMATPTIHALKHMFEGADVTVATEQNYLGGALRKVLKYNPDINPDETFDVDTDIREVNEQILLDHFDLVINLHCPAPAFELPRTVPPNRIDIFANHAGVKLLDPVPKYYITKDEVDNGEWVRDKILPGEKVMLVQPFSSSSTRNAVHSKLKSSITRLYEEHRIHSLIITHSDSDGPCDVLWDNIPGSLLLKNFDIRAIGGIIVHCDLVLCPDSSILHLAGALEVPTVSLFGPTSPQSRINYYKNTIAISEAKFPPCCCWWSSNSCPIGRKCWQDLQVDTIVDTCTTHLHATSRVNIEDLLNKNIPIDINTEEI